MTKNIKLGFTKSKAYGLCGVILSTALFTLFTVPVSADENNTASQPNAELITDNTPNVKGIRLYLICQKKFHFGRILILM